jgi:8-oxo-dGTP diphosphatase
MEPKLFIARKALIFNQGKVLVIRESPKYKEGAHIGKYDFPGGRLKSGEKFNESVIREIKEETGLDIKIRKPFFINEYRPIVHGETWQITRIFFKCDSKTKEINLSKDHDDFKWINPEEYKDNKVIENLHEVFEEYLR